MPQPWLQSGLDQDSVELARRALSDIVDHFREVNHYDDSQKVELYTFIAEKLSEMVAKSPPWGWRYIHNVLSPTVQLKPSKELARGVLALVAHIDGLPVMVAASEPVQVYAMPGKVRAGSIVYGVSARCPDCGVWFVPDHFSRRKCKTCSPPRVRKNGHS